MNSLKPCPFCGGEAELCYGPGLGTDSCRGYTLQASCNECCAKSPGLWQEKKPEPDDAIWKDAADEWNWRPGEEALKQLWSSNLDIINRELNKQCIEARAEIKLKNEELDMFLAEQQAMGEIIEHKDKLIEQMREALTEALQSADSEWENKNLGHDWKYACEQMRAALAAERGE